MDALAKRKRSAAKLRHSHCLYPWIEGMQPDATQGKPCGQTDMSRWLDDHELKVRFKQKITSRQAAEYTAKVSDSSAHHANAGLFLPSSRVGPTVLHTKRRESLCKKQ